MPSADQLMWVATRRDPLWVLSMRAGYRGLVRRAAIGIPGCRDDAWLVEAMAVLRLSALDFESDVAAHKANDPVAGPRAFGVWATEDDVDILETVKPPDSQNAQPDGTDVTG